MGPSGRRRYGGRDFQDRILHREVVSSTVRWLPATGVLPTHSDVTRGSLSIVCPGPLNVENSLFLIQAVQDPIFISESVRVASG